MFHLASGDNTKNGGLTASKPCLDCICEMESGCTNAPCEDDVGSLSCGYYQIKQPYYIECGEPEKQDGESVEDAWKRCAASKSCSEKMSDCETMARLHNGGPTGCQNSGPLGYWDKVQEHGC